MLDELIDEVLSLFPEGEHDWENKVYLYLKQKGLAEEEINIILEKIKTEIV